MLGHGGSTPAARDRSGFERKRGGRLPGKEKGHPSWWPKLLGEKK